MEKVKSLVIVAAPSCCGKSTFAQQLINGELPQIEKSAKINNPSNWIYKDIWLHEKELKTLSQSSKQEYILHYTIPYPALKFIFRRGYDKKTRLSILQSSENITFLTLFASPPTMLNRIQQRREHIYKLRKKDKSQIFRSQKALRTLKRLNRIYSDPNKFSSLYQKWFDFSSKLNLQAHYLVNVEKTPELVSLSRWPEITKEWKVKYSP